MVAAAAWKPGWSNRLSGERESCREPGTRSDCGWRFDGVDGRLVRQLTAASGAVPRGPCDFCSSSKPSRVLRQDLRPCRESGGVGRDQQQDRGPAHPGVEASLEPASKVLWLDSRKRAPTKESRRFGRRITAARYQFRQLSACLVRRGSGTNLASAARNKQQFSSSSPRPTKSKPSRRRCEIKVKSTAPTKKRNHP